MARSSMYPGPAVGLHCRRPQWIDGVRVKGEEARAGQGLDFEPPVFGGEEQEESGRSVVVFGGLVGDTAKWDCLLTLDGANCEARMNSPAGKKATRPMFMPEVQCMPEHLSLEGGRNWPGTAFHGAVQSDTQYNIITCMRNQVLSNAFSCCTILGRCTGL